MVDFQDYLIPRPLTDQLKLYTYRKMNKKAELQNYEPRVSMIKEMDCCSQLLSIG